jgi:hypothetical protein
MESDPAGRVVVLKVAMPLAFSVAVPRVVVPFRNVTVPVGIFVLVWEPTVAVSVTLWPVLAKVGDAWSAVVLAGSASLGQRNTVIEYGGRE